MKPWKHFVDTHITGKHLLILSGLSILCSGLFLRFGFPGIPTRTLLDTTFNFRPEQVHEVLGSYSPAVMKQYVRTEIIDMVMAPLTCLTEALIIVSGFRQWARVQWLGFLPVGLLTMNTLKDLLMLGIIKAYPHESALVVQVTNIVNMIKTVLVTASLLLACAAGISIIVRAILRHIRLAASA
jgi:hypothetical protein